MICINIVDYAESEMRCFSETPFSEVDSLILSQFSYLCLEEVVGGLDIRKRAVRMKDLYMSEKLPQIMKKALYPDANKKLLIALAGSPRFRDIKVNYYTDEVDEDLEKQFSAVCFILDKKTAYVAFRGTDTTFIGWKEDFNMAFMDEVPSQARSVEYLNTVASKLPKNLIIGGHSKGGNLAVYSASMCKPSVQRRISAVYSHDGPGFKSLLASEKFANIKHIVSKTVPQSSIIGMLLSTQEDYTVVKSNRMGIFQHDPFSWVIEDGAFIETEDISGTSKLADKALNGWVNELTEDERKKFIEHIYSVIKAAKINSVKDLRNAKLKDIKAVTEITSKMDKETKRFIFDVYKKLAVLSIKSIVE